jgi:hypothetical protein
MVLSEWGLSLQSDCLWVIEIICSALVNCRRVAGWAGACLAGCRAVGWWVGVGACGLVA